MNLLLQQCGELLSLREEDQPGTTSREEVQRRRKNGQPDFEAGTVQVCSRQHSPLHLEPRERMLLLQAKKELCML